ncbi:uncharacterized protein L199_004588 [Kwoniella botswanensis]|uniref:uncharacterized protein n=1 Tax=Kwoniella botswanensis TaxID=1268659 RepID=UPI00315CBAB8
MEEIRIPPLVSAWLEAQNAQFNNPLPLPPLTQDVNTLCNHAYLASLTPGCPQEVVEELTRIAFRLAEASANIPAYLQVGGARLGEVGAQIAQQLVAAQESILVIETGMRTSWAIDRNRTYSKINEDMIPVPVSDPANPAGPPLDRPLGVLDHIRRWSDVRAMVRGRVDRWLQLYDLEVPDNMSIERRRLCLYYHLGGSEVQVAQG